MGGGEAAEQGSAPELYLSLSLPGENLGSITSAANSWGVRTHLIRYHPVLQYQGWALVPMSMLLQHCINFSRAAPGKGLCRHSGKGRSIENGERNIEVVGSCLGKQGPECFIAAGANEGSSTAAKPETSLTRGENSSWPRSSEQRS